jgi:D-aminoacyl-tRNA deacylase
MLALIQRVLHASVTVNQEVISKIEQGILAFIGIEKTDTAINADRLLDKILHYRIFSDAEGKMNLSLIDKQLSLLLVPQFTLAADTNSGNRPSFSTAMLPSQSASLFNYIIEKSKTLHTCISYGQFGANMQILLCNDGPVTFLLQT